MTIGKASALAAGFVGAVVLGMAIGPLVTHRGDSAPPPAPAWNLSEPPTTAAQPAVVDTAAPSVPEPKVVRETRPKAAIVKTDKSAPRALKVSAAAPALGVRL